MSLHQLPEVIMVNRSVPCPSEIRKHSGPHRLVHECTISICTCVCLQCIKRTWDLNVRAKWNMVQAALEKDWDAHCSDVLCALSNCRVRRTRSCWIRIVLSVSLNSCLYARGMPMMHEYMITESTRGCMSMFLTVSTNLDR